MYNYEINEDTLAVIPIDNFKTKIIEAENEYLIKKNAYQIMEESCEYYGSSYVGRIKAAQKILNCSYKLPILVEESQKIIFFPTKSSLEETCCWLNYNNIKNYEKHDNKTKVIFNNNNEYIFDISKLSLQNQIFRSSRLESIIRKRLGK